MMQTYPVSGMLCFLEHRMLGKVQKLSNSQKTNYRSKISIMWWSEQYVWDSIPPKWRKSNYHIVNHLYIEIYLPTYPSTDPSHIFLSSHLGNTASVKRLVSLQFLNLRQLVGPLGRGISPKQGRYLLRATQTHNKRRQRSMPWVGFEPTIPAFKRAKTFHALDCAATVIGIEVYKCTYLFRC
jgi:hypothetical protein